MLHVSKVLCISSIDVNEYLINMLCFSTTKLMCLVVLVNFFCMHAWHAYEHVCMCMHVYVQARVRFYASMHTCVHACMYACLCPHTHTHSGHYTGQYIGHYSGPLCSLLYSQLHWPMHWPMHWHLY